MNKHIWLLVLFLALCLIVTACHWNPLGIPDDFEVEATIAVAVDEETLGVLQGAIDELGHQPGRWEETMQNTIEQLEKSGGQLAKTVLAEVRSTYNGILGQTTNEFSCRADFMAQRLQQRLQAIGHAIAPDRFKEPEIKPVICSTNPADQVQLDTTVLVFYGYDLLEFEQTQVFHAVLRYADTGQVVSEQAGYVSHTHNYQLVVDLQSTALKKTMRAMDRDRGPQIVLRWGATDVEDDFGKQSALPIILPEPEKTPMPYAEVGITIEFGGPFGYWGPTEMCPENTWVMRAYLMIEENQAGKSGDDTALNGIRLVCGTHNNPGYLTEITSDTGWYGEWEDAGQCSEGYVTGARLRIQPDQGLKMDDTGAVDAQFLCSNGTTLDGQTHFSFGEWKDIQTCPVGSAICGLETKVQQWQQKGKGNDNTALNDARFYCCTLP